MPTDLKNFQTDLNAMQDSFLIPVLKACRTKYASDNEATLNNQICMKKTSGAQGTTYAYWDGDTMTKTLSNYSGYLGDALDVSYSYQTLQTKVYQSASNYDYANYKFDLIEISNNLVDDTSFNNYHKTTANLYTQMKSTRQDLDNKMRSLYEDGYSDTDIHYENAVIVNLTCTVLATCVLYFIFVKL
jgi:hypothetical protein